MTQTTTSEPTGSETTRAPAIMLEALRRTFGDVAAVEGLDLEIADGEFFALIGPSGCGKTTTLRMLAGLDQPTSGRVLVHGKDVTGTPAHQRPVSTVFQQYALFPHLDVAENVGFGLKERKFDRAERRRRVGEMLELVDLSGRESMRPGQLSGGQQQRVALARSLVLEPEVLLLDEPLGALDLKLRRQLQVLLKRIQREVGVTFVYVTHDQEEAFSMSDQVGVMNAGRLEQVGRPRDVYRSPASLFVAGFVGSVNTLPGRVVRVVAPGSYEVELDGVGLIEMPGLDGLTQGQAVAVSVRPEAIQVAGSQDGPRLTGRVRDVSFLGPQTTYLLDTSGESTLNVTLPFGADVQLQVGQEEHFTWLPAAAWVLPADS